jgi:hypothetical protein
LKAYGIAEQNNEMKLENKPRKYPENTQKIPRKPN